MTRTLENFGATAAIGLGAGWIAWGACALAGLPDPRLAAALMGAGLLTAFGLLAARRAAP